MVFLVHTKQGGVLFATISITNLGLRTFDGALDVRFYDPEGEVFKLHREYRRQDISTAEDGLDLTIRSNQLKGSENSYHLSINESPLQMKLTLAKSLPGFRFGNGRIDFYEDRSAEWNIALDVPRAIASGTLLVGQKMFSLAGNGYHDHTWRNIKLPTFTEKWHSLRFFQERFSIVLHQIHLTKKFGGAMICAGLIGDGENLTPTRRFLYKPLKWRKEPTSGLAIPTELQLCIKTGNYSVTGTIKETRFLDAIDILDQIAWQTRMLIKAFYTKPYLIRYLAECDLDVIDKNGSQYHLSGTAVAGSSSY